MKKKVSVYRRGERLLFVPIAYAGLLGIEIEPVGVAQVSAPSEEIWAMLQQALDASGGQLEQCPPRDAPPVVLLRAAGVKSYRQFVKGTASCKVEKTQDGYVLTPLRPERGSFFYEYENAVQLPLSVPPSVAIEALLAVLEAAGTHP